METFSKVMHVVNQICIKLLFNCLDNLPFRETEKKNILMENVCNVMLANSCMVNNADDANF